jgi:Holliday junction resolvase-like predicted endonuclease
MFDGADLVFVEVKTRLSSPYTDRYLFDSINYYKQRKLKTLAQLFISFHCKHRPPPPYRIDVVGVLLERGGQEIKKIEHLVSAI